MIHRDGTYRIGSVMQEGSRAKFGDGGRNIVTENGRWTRSGDTIVLTSAEGKRTTLHALESDEGFYLTDGFEFGVRYGGEK